jgi:hypothetical protein
VVQDVAAPLLHEDSGERVRDLVDELLRGELRIRRQPAAPAQRLLVLPGELVDLVGRLGVLEDVNRPVRIDAPQLLEVDALSRADAEDPLAAVPVPVKTIACFSTT